MLRVVFYRIYGINTVDYGPRKNTGVIRPTEFKYEFRGNLFFIKNN